MKKRSHDPHRFMTRSDSSEPRRHTSVVARGSASILVALLLSCYSGLDASQMTDGSVSSGSEGGTTGETTAGEELDPHRDAELAFPGMAGVPAVILIETPTGVAEVQHLLIEGYGVLEGDIILYTPEGRRATDIGGGESKGGKTPSRLVFPQHLEGAIRTDPEVRWPGAIVPYVIATNLPNQDRIQSAIEHWHANTPIRLVERTNEPDYVEFVNGAGCWSQIGRQMGRQTITLGDGCGRGASIHEIGHAVGLWHEQSRFDQSDNVEILWENIKNDMAPYFKTYEERGFDGADIGAYDFGSIMHYGPRAFGKCDCDDVTAVCPCIAETAQDDGTCERPAFTCVDGEAKCDNGEVLCNHPRTTITRLGGGDYSDVFQRNGLSEGDIAAIEAMYPNPGGSNCLNEACDPGETCQSCPQDCGPCAPTCNNGEGMCDAGETCQSCPQDCGPCAPVCADGTCNGMEDCESCPQDCGACPPGCPDGVCSPTETCEVCPQDCGVCPPICSDGVCNGTETCSTCSPDCGVCPCSDTYGVAQYECNNYSFADEAGDGGGEIFEICASIDPMTGMVTIHAQKADGSSFGNRPYQVRVSDPADPACGPNTNYFVVSDSNPAGVGTPQLTFTFQSLWGAEMSKAYCVTASTVPTDPGYMNIAEQTSWWHSRKAIVTKQCL